MRIFSACLLFLCAVLVASYGDGIIVLDHHNFDQVLSQAKYVMVEFYRPDCTECLQFANEYAKAAQRMAFKYPHIKFFEVDGSTETYLVQDYNIQTFPTTKFYIRGSKTPLEYKGKASADEIFEWVKTQSEKESIEVQTVKEAEQFISENDVVGLFFGSTGSKKYEEYLEVAKKFDDIVFINSDSEEIKKKLGLGDKKAEGFAFFRNYGEKKGIFDGFWSTEELTDFIKGEQYEAVVPFDKQTRERIFKQGENAIFLFKSRGDIYIEEEAFKTAANDLKGKVIMTIVNFDDNIEIPVTDSLSIPLNRLLAVKKEGLPAIRILEPTNRMKRYGLQGPINEKNIKDFFEKFRKGELKPLYISAPIPEESYKGDVRIVVGKNFEEVVVDKDQNVLVLFCNPRYQSCKSFEPIYSALATKLRNVKNLSIVQLDSSTNEVEGLKFRSAVDVRLYARGKKSSPIMYEGGDNEFLLLNFIEENVGRLDERKEIRNKTAEL